MLKFGPLSITQFLDRGWDAFKDWIFDNIVNKSCQRKRCKQTEKKTYKNSSELLKVTSSPWWTAIGKSRIDQLEAVFLVICDPSMNEL
jgi:hypothetical protein